ncbi:hypothetical protein BHYA_0006g00560 [Botrytis hyacinthi]|uniref:Uncharacterized protein n=1 Tax=Botrytis hyacinthi TaxID=278943 RepID=A0A4Z1H094_9HELO|nr:hypothetical protein BHYA_0006g00560 [Botrytis hyacinthi]
MDSRTAVSQHYQYQARIREPGDLTTVTCQSYPSTIKFCNYRGIHLCGTRTLTVWKGWHIGYSPPSTVKQVILRFTECISISICRKSSIILYIKNTDVPLIIVPLFQISSIEDGTRTISIPGNKCAHDVPGHFGKEAVRTTDVMDPPVWLKDLILALQGATNTRVLK